MVDELVAPDALKASLRSVKEADKEVELAVRLSNTAARALHYISDVRAIRFDPQTRILRVSFSDEGRQVIPGAINKRPVFRHIDPQGEAELRVKVPNRVIKLARTTPPGGVAFETHHLSEVEEIVVEIAWADVPYYEDTRPPGDDRRLPTERWQQHKAQARKRIKEEGEGERPKSPRKG